MEQINLSFPNKAFPYLRLFRVFETTMIAGTVIMALIMMGSTNYVDFSQIAITIWFAGAGIACWNDALDIEEDRISHPERPIPKGEISLFLAKILGTVHLVISISFSIFISFEAGILIIVSTIVGVGYSVTTKRFLFLKNFTVIISGIVILLALPRIYNFETDSFYSIFVLSISLLLFSYEILKDIHDIEGDKAVGIKTFVMLTSPSTTSKFSVVLFISSCMLMSLGFFSKRYFLEGIISFVTAFILLIPASKLINNPSPKNSEIMRYVIVSIILVSLTIIAGLLLNRNING